MTHTIAYRSPVWFAALLFLLLSAIQAYKPLNLDNADLPVWAKAVADTGKPIAYRGEDRPSDTFVYHTPLYLYALGGWIKIFGYGVSQIRMFGVACALLLGLICIQTFHEIFARHFSRKLLWPFWPVFLLNPYTLQSASIADTDTTVYGPLLCGFLLACVRLAWRNGQQLEKPARLDLIIAAVVLGLCFWAKLTTVLLVIPVPLLMLLPPFGWKRAGFYFSIVVGGGAILFLSTYAAWCYWIGVKWNTCFVWLYSYFATRGSSGQSGLMARIRDYSRNSTYMLPFTMKWTGGAPWIAALAVCGLSAWKLARKDMRFWPALLILGVALGSTTYYAGQTLSFGNSPFKYHYVFWGIVCLPLAVAAGWMWSLATETGGTGMLTGLCAVTAAAGLWVGARVLTDRLLTGAIPVGQNWFYWLLPLVCVVIVASLSWTTGQRKVAAAVIVSAIVFHVSMETGICIYQVKQPYSTTYNYGQRGLVETAAFIQAISRPDEILMCMKDLGPMTDRHYYESYSYIYSGSQGATTAIDLMSSRVHLAAFTEQIGEDQLVMNEPLMHWVAKNCRLLKSVGNYRIYETPSRIAQNERVLAAAASAGAVVMPASVKVSKEAR